MTAQNILICVLIVVLLAAMLSWGWGYGPTGVIGLVLLVVTTLVATGQI